jgi:hypothetical protein
LPRSRSRGRCHGLRTHSSSWCTTPASRRRNRCCHWLAPLPWSWAPWHCHCCRSPCRWRVAQDDLLQNVSLSVHSLPPKYAHIRVVCGIFLKQIDQEIIKKRSRLDKCMPMYVSVCVCN